MNRVILSEKLENLSVDQNISLFFLHNDLKHSPEWVIYTSADQSVLFISAYFMKLVQTDEAILEITDFSDSYISFKAGK